VDELRPNPDALLAALQEDEAGKKRGKLKVFFGMAPGVGKTYAMLEGARRELAAGRDVVSGYVETHGRKETDALAQGLPAIPRLQVEYRGMSLPEMNLDALLARRPQLALVDELAHTNAPGSRHPKRCQDVVELLDAGIDVFTTLNVQHVESRAEVVRQITGVAIRETVPDSVLDGAEFELVDLPPEELRARLAAGKVYVPESARAAQEHFFRPGNLAALRELALRFAAEHVGQDVLAYRQAHGVADPWKTGQRLLVAVSASPTSASLVRWTRRLAGELQAGWLAVYVELPRPLVEAEQTRLSRHLALARELGAQVITTTDNDVARGLLRVAREQNVTQMVIGKPVGWRALELLRGGGGGRPGAAADAPATVGRGVGAGLRRRPGGRGGCDRTERGAPTLARLPVAGAGLSAERRDPGDVRWTRPYAGGRDRHGTPLELLVRAAPFHLPYRRSDGRDAVHHLLCRGAGDGTPGGTFALGAGGRATPGAALHRALPADAGAGPSLGLRRFAGHRDPGGRQGG